MNTYPKMNEQIVGILRWTDNPAGLYAADRIEELEAERDALASVLEDANELHAEVRVEREKLRTACEAMMEFSICTVFDAKGTYTLRKAKEWAKLRRQARAALGKPEEEEIT